VASAEWIVLARMGGAGFWSRSRMNVHSIAVNRQCPQQDRSDEAEVAPLSRGG